MNYTEQDRISSRRRRVLKGALGVGVVGTAGCLGDDDDSTTLSLGHTGEGSITGGVALSAQRVIREHSDSLTLGPEGTGGDPSSVRLMAGGDLDAALLNPHNIFFALNDSGPFSEEPVDNEELPLQCFSGALMQVTMVARSDSGIESTDDLIDSDHQLWAVDPEWGWYTLFEQLFGEIDVNGESYWENIEDRIVPVGSDDAPGAMEEGNIDAALVFAASLRGLPSYTAEKDARVDLTAVEIGDDIQSAVEDHPAVSGTFGEPYGWDQDLGTDEVFYLSQPTSVYASEDVSDDAIYELMEQLHQNAEMMVEGSETNLDLSDPENLTWISPDYSFHPGAAEWLRDYDLWQDEYSEGGPVA